VFDSNSLKRTQISKIMKKVREGKPAADQRGFNTKRHIRNLPPKSLPRWRVE
jgi:hypothetical protein